MQYNITINQKQLVELSQKLGVKINLKTATVLNYFKEAHTVFQQKIIDGSVWYRVDYTKVLEQNPLLDIEKKQLANHFQLLVEMLVLDKFLDKASGNQVYFKPGENYIPCFFDVPPIEKNFHTYRKKLSYPIEKNFYRYNIEHSNNKHNKIEHTENPLSFFLDNHMYKQIKDTNFPDLTDQQVETNLKVFLSDYPNAKSTSMTSFLTDLNKKLKKTSWEKAKEKEQTYQKQSQTTQNEKKKDAMYYESKKVEKPKNESVDEAKQMLENQIIETKKQEILEKLKKGTFDLSALSFNVRRMLGSIESNDRKADLIVGLQSAT